MMVSKRREAFANSSPGQRPWEGTLQAQVMNSERVREFKHVRAKAFDNPFRVAMLFALITQGSAPAARNPGLEVVNAFGVLVRVAQLFATPAIDFRHELA